MTKPFIQTWDYRIYSLVQSTRCLFGKHVWVWVSDDDYYELDKFKCSNCGKVEHQNYGKVD